MDVNDRREYASQSSGGEGGGGRPRETIFMRENEGKEGRAGG